MSVEVLGTGSRDTQKETALRPSSLAFGGARLGAFWQGGGFLDQVRALQAAIDLGINVVDTADVYARGLSETLVGRIVQPLRDEMILCTKVGQVKTPGAAVAAARAERLALLPSLSAAFRKTPSSAAQVPRCFHSSYLENRIEGCLRRLRTDRVEILLLHSPNVFQIRKGSFRRAAASLLKSGKVLHFGVSCDSVDVARLALKDPLVTCLELPIDAFSDTFAELVEHAARKKVLVLARSPFGGGSIAQALCGLEEGEREEAAAAILQSVAERPGISSVVVGMGTAERVRGNVRALRNPMSAEQRRHYLERIERFVREGVRDVD